MKHNNIKLGVLLCALALPCAYASKQTPSEKFGKFVASVELGYIMTSGNTESTSFIVKADVGNETESFRNQFSFDSLFKQDEVTLTDNETGVQYTEKVTSKEKYSTSVQTNYKVNEDGDAILAFGSYESNRFSNFHYQASIATGYNTRLLDSNTGFLDLSFGPGYSFDSVKVKVNADNQQIDGSGNLILDDSGNPIIGDEEARNQLIWRAAATYQRKITEEIKFKAAYSIEDGDYNTKSTFESSLTMQVNGSLALKAAILNKRNSSDGTSSSDKRNSITLVYNF
ncbi:DUF481 domain-containing protein [Catenovulum sediminis]|uniref:DUF481 domain-containing protein n=1 Tax=Catenovulum sediminis TaxID=1740262 RepID=A0ABV1RCQ6_9ALTE|nr:DUF481 domain-containing protein [Catenovulum sediminis]